MRQEFDLKQLNRFYLKSHFLLENGDQTDLVKVVGKICGLNAQTARAPYLSLWNRVKDFEKDRLDAALYENRLLIKTWLMRGTVHIIPVQDYPIYQKALGRNLAEGWQEQLQKHGLGLSASKRGKLHKRILDSLAQAALTKSELLPEVQHLLKNYSGKDQKIILGRTLRELNYRGLVCHAQPTGSWYHFKENRFTTVEHWMDGIDLLKFDEREAKIELLLKYLHGYGPASIQDFAYWTGFRVTDSRRVFEELDDRLTEVRIRGVKGPFWILKEDLISLDNVSIEERPSVRFLPEFDSLIMGHKDKSRIIDEKYRKQIFLPLADVAPTILFDGHVAGVWNFKMTTKSLSLSSFETVGSMEHNVIEMESSRLKQFLEFY